MFFPLEIIKTILGSIQPFIPVLITPLIIDELCGGRRIEKLGLYVGWLIFGEMMLFLVHNRIAKTIEKYKERLDNQIILQTGRHAMELDFQLTEDKAALDQLEKANTGMNWYSGGAYGISEQVFMIIGSVFRMFGMIAVIALHAPALLALIIVFVIFGAFITQKNNRIEMMTYSKLAETNRIFGYFGWDVVDFRFGKDVRLYDAKDLLLEHWEKNTKKSNEQWRWQADQRLPFALLGGFLDILRRLLIFAYSAGFVAAGVFSVGVFTQMIEASNGLSGALQNLIDGLLGLVKRCNYAYEYVVFMEYPEAMVKGDCPVENRLHEFEFRDVTFTYPGTDHKVLDHVNIKIKPGERLSVVGLNGAGKTTFIKLLCRLYDPDSGQILMDGRDIRDYDYRQYMQQFAPVFQDFKLFAFSIQENIAFEDAKNAEKAHKMDEILHLVELEELIGRLEKGKDTSVFKFFDEAGIEPSGGEQQKLAIARALYKDSPVMLLDEPTSALDPIAEYEVYRRFNTLVGDKTAIYISHRLSSCRFCDKIAVFQGGRIAEYGNHEQLKDVSNGVYAEMFHAQAKYYAG